MKMNIIHTIHFYAWGDPGNRRTCASVYRDADNRHGEVGRDYGRRFPLTASSLLRLKRVLAGGEVVIFPDDGRGRIRKVFRPSKLQALTAQLEKAEAKAARLEIAYDAAQASISYLSHLVRAMLPEAMWPAVVTELWGKAQAEYDALRAQIARLEAENQRLHSELDALSRVNGTLHRVLPAPVGYSGTDEAVRLTECALGYCLYARSPCVVAYEEAG